ncbi:hypothetical protein [Dysgonomonas sp. 511]|uniref:hypothetical protein n=1 Tax=Dysgonomonas sp. 511 TaxID=2302930 RepID=UPI0013D193D8|nr:hypothetical protein [Dysgonomonas sp. 511]NDV79121.1 hypothetical protein [Dysgonomonas sp. 511]
MKYLALALFLFLFVFLFSCRNNEKQTGDNIQKSTIIDSVFIQKAESTEIETVDIPITADVIAKVKPKAQAWLRYYSLDISDFTLSDSSVFYLQNCYTQDIEISPDELKADPFRDLYAFSPDRSKLIDMYYYESYDEKRGTVVFGGEPDQAVWLYDIKAQKAYQVWFTGPSGVCDAVFWINNNSFVLLTNYDNEYSIVIYDSEEENKKIYAVEGNARPDTGSFFYYDGKRKGVKDPIYSENE